MKTSKVIEKKGKKIIVAPKTKQNKIDSSQNQTLKKKTKQTGAATKAARGAFIGSL